MTATASMSASTDSVAMVSKSHCTNSRYRPACGFSPRHTGSDVVAFERGAKRADVLSGKTGQGNGQVKSHADIATTVVLETIDLAVGFIAAFSREYFQVLKHRRVDGGEPKRAEDLAGGLHHPFTWDHDLGQVVAKTLERSWLNQRHGAFLRS